MFNKVVSVHHFSWWCYKCLSIRVGSVQETDLKLRNLKQKKRIDQVLELMASQNNLDSFSEGKKNNLDG